MKIHFLGTNGWYDTETGNTLCTLIETKKEYIILDAGNGLYKIDRFIKTKKPIYLFLSHYHLDHIIGLHTLALFDFPQGIKVFGPPGLKKMFNQIIDRPYSMPISQIKTKVRLHELRSAKKNLLGNKAIPGVEFLSLQHAVTCYGYRILLEGKIISYTTDTGLCPALSTLMKNADLAICESAFLPGMDRDPWGHLRPEDAAAAARAAGAKKLVLVHFDAGLYHTLADRERGAARARKIFKNTLAAGDGIRVDI